MPLSIYKCKDKLEVGVDEVGRGCLFGDVYSAAVIMPHEFEDDTYLQIKDSKKLSPKKREHLYDYIIENAIGYGIGIADVKEIDRYNILNASFLAMHRALDKVNITVDTILVDGDKFKPYIDFNDEYPDYDCIPGGDNIYLNIASASILAKVSRDRYINNLVSKNPYLFDYKLHKNKGYGTKDHIDAILQIGITKYHRKTFGICKNYQ